MDGVASDNGANFVKAVELTLSSNVTEEHVRCACHTLQFSIKTGKELFLL